MHYLWADALHEKECEATYGVFDSTDISAKIENEINRVKTNNAWRDEYMFQEMHNIEMKEEGREEGKIEDIKMLLKKMSPKEIIEHGV